MEIVGQSDNKRTLAMEEERDPESDKRQKPGGDADEQSVTPPSAKDDSAEEAEGADTIPATPSADRSNAARRRKKKVQAVSEEEVVPRPSYLPIALAFSLILLFIGIISHSPIVFGVSVLLIAVILVAWTLERR